MNEHTQPADLEAFKQAFRRHAAGVAIVTSLAPDGSPVGFTATSLASLAAVPPLVTFNMARVSSAWPAMTVGNIVAIHMLGPRSKHQAERMAADRDVRFVGEHWAAGPEGVPLLHGTTAWMVGRIIEIHPVHNNAVIVVQVESGELGEEDAALLYHERRYMTPAELAEEASVPAAAAPPRAIESAPAAQSPVSLIRSSALSTAAEYAYAATAPAGSRLVFLAGACPISLDGVVENAGDYAAQAAVAFDNLVLALTAAGASVENLISTRVLVASSNRSDLVTAWEVVRDALGDHDVPSTLMGVTVLGYHHQLVEIEAVAALPE